MDYIRLPGFESWLYHLLDCVTLGKLFKLSGPWFFHLQNEDSNSTYLMDPYNNVAHMVTTI